LKNDVGHKPFFWLHIRKQIYGSLDHGPLSTCSL
jgi:hypothetical protein